MGYITWVDIGNLWLVLSHFSVLPSISIAIGKGLMSEAAALIAMALVSTVYHVCQVGYFCVLPFHVLQTSDHFFVYSALAWLLLFFTDASIQHRFIAFILLQGFLLPMILSFMHEAWLIVVVVGASLFIGIIYISVIVKKKPIFNWRDLIFAAILLISGIILHLYAGEPGSANYAWSHTIWHITSMLSVYFIFESKDEIFWFTKLTRIFQCTFYRKRKKNNSYLVM